MKSFEVPCVIQELIRDSRAVMNGVCGVWAGVTLGGFHQIFCTVIQSTIVSNFWSLNRPRPLPPP